MISQVKIVSKLSFIADIQVIRQQSILLQENIANNIKFVIKSLKKFGKIFKIQFDINISYILLKLIV